MEMVAEAKVLIVEMVCDECGKGTMRPHGDDILSTYPPQYPHKCDKCGCEKTYHTYYPKFKYIPIESLREPVGREITD